MATAAKVDIGSLIRATPGVNGGRPCIAGTGISVLQVAALFTGGLSPEEIQDEYPHVGIAAVYAAIAHYMANQQAMDAELWEEAELHAHSKAEQSAGGSPAF